MNLEGWRRLRETATTLEPEDAKRRRNRRCAFFAIASFALGVAVGPISHYVNSQQNVRSLSQITNSMRLASALPKLQVLRNQVAKSRVDAAALADRLSDLLRVKDSIRIEGERLRTETSRLDDMRTRLAGLAESKRQSFAEHEGELAQLHQTEAGASLSITTERRAKELQSDLEKIAAGRERINARLFETSRLIEMSEAQLNLIESRLGELEVQETLLRQRLEARYGSISEALAEMRCIRYASFTKGNIRRLRACPKLVRREA